MDDDKLPYAGLGAGYDVGEDVAGQFGMTQVDVFWLETLSCKRFTAVSGERLLHYEPVQPSGSSSRGCGPPS